MQPILSFTGACLKALACLLALSAALPAAAAPAAVASDCASPVTQAAMNDCAFQDFLVAGESYSASTKALADKLGPKQQGALRRTQKAWLAYRTAACDFESSALQGGSAQPMVKWQCAARMTRARTAELTRLANCPEGDLSCPR